MVHGDSNCSTVLIPGYIANARVVEIENFIPINELSMQNPPEPTWHRGTLTGINDNYFCRRGMQISHPEILESIKVLSDHYLMESNLRAEVQRNVTKPKSDYGAPETAISELIPSLPVLSTHEDNDSFILNLTGALQTTIQDSYSSTGAVRPRLQ